MNRKGLTVIEVLVIFVILAVLFALLAPAVDKAREEAKEAKEKRAFGPYAAMYEKTVMAAVQRLLIDGSGPLTERERGRFETMLEKGTPITAHEAALAAFSAKDWPAAKKADELAKEMRLLMGLMKTAEDPYAQGAKESFEKKNEELKRMIQVWNERTD